MIGRFWQRWRTGAFAATIAISGSWLAAQEPAQPVAFDKYYVPDPSAEDYEQLLSRLQATEARIQSLEQRGGGADGGPIDHPEVRADGNPRTPSTDQRLSALEKSLGGPTRPAFPSVRLTGFF